jgi:pilus assembly protein Flp/PilA
MKLKRILTDDRGVTSIEYGLLAVAVAVAIVLAVFTLGTEVAGLFSSLVSALEAQL